MLVEGRHFLSTVRLSGWAKALATISDQGRLRRHAAGLHAGLADAARGRRLSGWFSRACWTWRPRDIELVEATPPAGPLNLCITVFGEVPVGQALRRDSARAANRLWVNNPHDGGIGDARLALEGVPWGSAAA